mmetsp:Transcript_68114/g.221787  ORF Transcript_68114/g.221787 Transcript_68114/m.221787 type:complete len:254 (+) Transcript_68114:397-1158(+)
MVRELRRALHLGSVQHCERDVQNGHQKADRQHDVQISQLRLQQSVAGSDENEQRSLNDLASDEENLGQDLHGHRAYAVRAVHRQVACVQALRGVLREQDGQQGPDDWMQRTCASPEGGALLPEEPQEGGAAEEREQICRGRPLHLHAELGSTWVQGSEFRNQDVMGISKCAVAIRDGKVPDVWPHRLPDVASRDRPEISVGSQQRLPALLRVLLAFADVLLRFDLGPLLVQVHLQVERRVRRQPLRELLLDTH